MRSRTTLRGPVAIATLAAFFPSLLQAQTAPLFPGRQVRAGTDTPATFSPSQPHGIAVADFDGDGRADVATANFFASNVSVSLQLPGASPGAPGALGVPSLLSPGGSQPIAIAAEDLQGDSEADLVWVNFNGNSMVVRAGVGNGTFGAPQVFSTGPQPISLLLADLDGDGRQDAVVGNYGGDSVTVRLGTGAGGFGAASSFAAGPVVFFVAAGDVNRDGLLDVAVANATYDGAVTLLRGDGAGGFASSSTVAVGRGPTSVALGDLTHDGALDLVTTNFHTGDLSILAGDGHGAFSTIGTPVVGRGPSHVVLRDFDGDANLDLAVANRGSDDVAVILGDGSGGAIATSRALAGPGAGFLVAADLDGDGKLDLGVTNTLASTVTRLRGDGAGHFESAGAHGAGSRPNSIVSVDCDGDGERDLVVANYGSDSVTILRGDGTGGFAPGESFETGTGPYTVAAADLDGDGRLDLVTANFLSKDVSILRGTAQGGFRPPVHVGVPGRPIFVVLGRIDGDSFVDAIVAGYGEGLFLLRGDGAGGLLAPEAVDLGMPARTTVCIALGDVNQDGRVDLATGLSTATTSRTVVALGDGRGGFSSTAAVPAFGFVNSVLLEDVASTGQRDLVTANAGIYVVSVHAGNGVGGFGLSPITSVQTPTAPEGVVAADFDGDGRLDLATANWGFASSNVATYPMLASGVLGAGALFATGRRPYALVADDWNHDGRVDLATANFDSADVTVLLNGATLVAAPIASLPRAERIVDDASLAPFRAPGSGR